MDFERKRPHDRIGKYIFVSLMIHVITAVVFTVKAIFFAGEPILFEPAIKVDLVALPDKVLEEPAAPAAAEPAAAEPTPPPPVAEEKKPEPPPPTPTPPKPAPEPVVKLETKKDEKKKPDLAEQQKKQKEALAKLKQQSALEEIENEIKESEKKKAAATPKKEFKGNVISPGTSLTGISKLQAESYISDVYRHMKENWALPDYLRQRSLVTEVLVKFDQQGNIVSKTVLKSSGNSAFDDLVLTAVQKSSPVPPPPEKFVRISELQGFLFRFSE